MSTMSRRVLTVTVAAVIAVFTGVLVGLLSARASCTPVLAPKAAASPAAAQTTAVSSPVAGLGGSHAEPVRPPAALAALGGAGLAGLAVLALLLASAGAGAGTGRTVAPAPAATPLGGTGAGAAAQRRRAEADRAALVRACIYVRDRITSKALGDRLGAALQEAGVSVVEPAGQRFDPAHHEAGGATPSDDPSKVGTIAAVEVPGYSDRGRVLRPPVVTVYQPGGKKLHTDPEDPQS